MHREQGLFRQEAIDAQNAPSLGVVRLATPVSHAAWMLVAVGIGGAIVAWLIVGSYTQREHVSGTLVPQAGLLTVIAQHAGTVTRLDVAEGSAVRAGQTLFTISDDRHSASMGDASAAVSAQLRQQQARLRADLADTRQLAAAQAADLAMQLRMLHQQAAQLDAQMAIQQHQVTDLSGLLHRLQALGTKGYVSALDIQQQRTQEQDAESQVQSLARQRTQTVQQLKSTADQLAQLPLDTQTKLNDLQRQIDQAQAQLVQNEADRATVQRAPDAGTVTSLLVHAGQSVSAGQTLLTVMPNARGGGLLAQLLVPSSAIGFVHVGTKVLLHYQAFPYEKFGVQHGRVVTVSRSALTPSEITTLLGEQPPPVPLYRVDVRLAAQTIEAYGKAVPLRPGMALDADLMLDRRRMIEWIFEPLYGMGRR